MEIVKDVNQYCGVSQDKFLVLKDSGVVLGAFYEHTNTVRLMSKESLRRLLDAGIKVSGNMPRDMDRQVLNDGWVKNEHERALQPGYPLFSYGKCGNAKGKVTVGPQNTQSPIFMVGDVAMMFEWTKEGLYLVCPSTSPHYITFGRFIIKIPPVAIYETREGQYMGTSQKIHLQYTSETNLDIEYDITIKEVVMIKTSTWVNLDETEKSLTSLLTPGLTLVPLLNNIKQFCQVNNPDVDTAAELVKYRHQLTAYDEDMSKMKDLLVKYDIPVSEKLIDKRQEVETIIKQIESFNYEKLHQQVREHLSHSLAESQILGPKMYRLKLALEDSSVPMTEVLEAYNEVEKIVM